MWRGMVGLAVGVLGAFGVGWGWIGPTAMDGECQYRENALWLSVDWTSASVSPDAVVDLTEQIRAHRVRYIYPYVSYLKEDGTWSQSYDHAREFLDAYREIDDETQILAWIGIPLQNPMPFGVQGWVDLGEDKSRRQIAVFAEEMIGLGFDGVHLNVESVRNDDGGFLALLEEVRAAIGDEAMLSIAGAHWVAAPIGNLPVVGRYGWQSHFYGEVGERVDQIATMTYDSHMPLAALYRLWVREQVRGVAESLNEVPVEVIWGVSVSREVTRSHRPAAENLASGLTAICAGGEAQPQQVAIYAAWEMAEMDWVEMREWQ